MYQIKRGDEVLDTAVNKLELAELIYRFIKAEVSYLDEKHLDLASCFDTDFSKYGEFEIVEYNIMPIAAKYGLTITKE